MVLLLGGQIALGWTLRYKVPHRDLLPPPPTQRMAEVAAFGDRQFFFRRAALDFQEAGDTGGRIVPIGNYDSNAVLGWLHLLQDLDPRSIIPVGLAAGYFGHSQDLSKVPPVIGFIREAVNLDPVQRWQALYEAIFLAKGRLKDSQLALDVASQLSSYGPDVVPQFAALSPAFILEQDGDKERAHAIVEKIRARYAGRLTPAEDEWSRAYLAYLSGQGPRPK
ncbi:MAG: hypothetical protein K1X51_01325 [Rhodospirillaceae bacterium]|nr:hypothetical protein [Rhodospirillaceae bacterium]